MITFLLGVVFLEQHLFFFDLQRKSYLQVLKKDFVLLKKLIVIAMRKE